MKTIHFVYALPRLENRFSAVVQMAGNKILHRSLLHRGIDEYKWPKPLKAPYSITYYVANFLAKKYRLRLYALTEKIRIKPSEDDILLGHVWPDPKSIVWRSIEDAKFSKRYLIQPYNSDENQIGWMRPAMDHCDKLFAISGDYWMGNLSSSSFANYCNKMVHLNMAVDSTKYPVIKQSFNKVGSRRFFYIGRQGRFSDEKGIGLLESLAAKIPGFEGGYICSEGEIRGWKKISEPTNLSPKFMCKIAAYYDVFVNMSRADAQATTILEAMSWGFPVACTRQTGYCQEEGLFYLSLDDMDFNIETIAKIQSLPDSELKRLAVINRIIVEEKYSWGNFLSRIEDYF